MTQFLLLVDAILFGYFAFSVSYVLIFALFSFLPSRSKYPLHSAKSSFLIVIPSYKDDSVIFDSVQSALAVNYPTDKFSVIVVSEKMEEETNDKLQKLGIKLIKIESNNSSKANALQEAITSCSNQKFDIVLILDADNIIEPDILDKINDVFYSGSRAIQLHRCAKNPQSPTAILDAISEEINNAIYRKGHNTIGLSSALIGSGMAIEYEWFAKNVYKLSTAGEDKELEILLFNDRIYINYLDSVKVYDEKVKNERIYFNQRQRWIAAQFGSLQNSIKKLPRAIFTRNFDLADKIIQWMLLPRVAMLGIILLFAVLTSIIDPVSGVKWWIIFVILTFALTSVIPDYLITRANIKVLKKIPLIFIFTLLNFFRIKGANKRFIHTIKGR